MDAATTTAKTILKKERHYAIEASSSATVPSAAGGRGRSPSSPPPAASGSDGKPTPGGNAKKKHLVWDEHAIEEHDLLRGTRMKIDEPKTPYTEYEYHSDGESVSSGRHLRSPDENHPKNRGAPDIATQWGDISSKLQAVADRRDGLPSSPTPSWNASGGEDEKKEAFKDMRKKHYNEAEEIRRWKAEHADDDDIDDDSD